MTIEPYTAQFLIVTSGAIILAGIWAFVQVVRIVKK